jgi:molybdenum cofactor cytidylyltransferase
MISAIIPAAGQSRRMGVQKQLLPFAATTVIGHIVDQLLRSSVDGVYVVVGHHADQIAQALSDRDVRIVLNPDYQQTEMLSSIRCGLRAVPQTCEAVLVALSDQPAITTELVNAMLRAYATSGKGIVVPMHGGKRGHPLLFARRYCEEVQIGYDQGGLRGLLSAHPEDLLELSVPSAAVLSDIDYPEDYRRELARRGKGPC